MKNLLLKIFLILTCICSIGYTAELSGLKGYGGQYIPEGSFIPVENTAEISTEFAQTGTQVKFIGTNDFFLGDLNVLPRRTEFYGYVAKVNEPIIGTNGSMIIKIVKMRLPDGYEQAINAYIYSANNNIIGGEMTSPSSYDAMPIYYQGYDPGFIRTVPGASRKKGEHTIIEAGDSKIIILARPLFIKHTLIN
ncbi:hypothetical protein KBA27_06505 [bacterium]|nr:hypothetical protein [bacterium]